MANLGETTKVSRMVLVFGGKEYELGGGGGGSQPAPNSVGTEELKNGAVQMEDLNDSVKGKIRKTYDEDDETLHMDFDEMDVNNSPTQEAGAGEDEVSGDGPSLDDLGDLDDLPGGGFNDPMTEEEGD